MMPLELLVHLKETTVADGYGSALSQNIPSNGQQLLLLSEVPLGVKAPDCLSTVCEKYHATTIQITAF